MSNLEIVREELERPSQFSTDRHAALSALSAHEQEVVELVEIAKKFSMGTFRHADFGLLTAALRPFTGDDK